MNKKLKQRRVLAGMVSLAMAANIVVPMKTINVFAEEVTGTTVNAEENVVTDKQVDSLENSVLEDQVKPEEKNAALEEKNDVSEEKVEPAKQDSESKETVKSVDEKSVTTEKAKVAEQNFDVQLLATSDMHGRFVPFDYATCEKDLSGSLAQVSTKVKELRAKNPNTIVVDNGDTIQDNSSSLFLDEDIHPMVAAMNEIGYDTWSYGNHEFNYGMDKLNQVKSKFNGTALCGNVYSKDGNRIAKPYAVKEFKQGEDTIKVGIIGVVTHHITKWDGPNLVNYEVKDAAKEAKKIADELEQKENPDVIIITAHVGENTEYGGGDSARAIAKAVPEAAAIIAGHAHSTIKGVREGDVLITEPNKGAGMMSQVNIKLTKGEDGKYKINDRQKEVTSNLIEMKPKTGEVVQPDKDLENKLEKYHQRALDDANTKIGELKGGDLAPKNEVKGITQAQIQDSAMIDLINEVEMKYGNAKVASSAVFKPTANLKEGSITKAGLTSIYKFDNTLMTLELTGKQLKKYMEWSMQYFNTYTPGDLTVSFDQNVRNYNYDMFSGVKYDVDISEKAGSRVKNLTYTDGKPVTDTEIIRVAVNNYRANTTLLNESTGLFKGENVKVVYNSFDELGDDGRIRDLIRKYVVEEKGGVITPEVDNNWKLIGNNWDQEQRDLAVKYVNNGKIQIPTSEDGRTPNVKAVRWEDVVPVLEGSDKDILNRKIDIVTFNDFHGALKEEGKNVGAAKFVGEVNRLKKANPNTFVVSAGDMYQGSAMSNLLKGAPITEMLKKLDVEVSAVGNHEFDWGLDTISQWSKDGGFDFVASNIYDKETNKPVEWTKPYKVIEIGNKKIGFVGLATPETAFKTKPSNVEKIEFRDPLESTNIWAKKLREEEKVDAVIVLSHLGAMQDKATKEITGEAAELAKNAKGIDAIICSHTHQLVNGKVNNLPVIQAMNNGRALGKLSLTFNKDNKLESIDQNVDEIFKRVKELPVDAEMKTIYENFEKDMAPILNEKVVNVDTELTHDRFEGLSKLGQFMTKYMAEITGSQIAITNGGGLRKPLPKGDITVGDMWDVMPFDNTLVTMKVTGSQLKKVVENGILNKTIGWGQFYGLRVYYDKDKEQGNRITSMRLLDGTKIEDNKEYSLVTNDFMAVGGDNYDFTGAKDIVDTAEPIRDAIINKLKPLKAVSFTFDDNTLVAGEDPVVDGNESGNENGNENGNTNPGENGNDNGNTNPGENNNGNGENLPQTGSPIGSNEMMAIGLIALITGSVLVLRKKKTIA